MSHSGATANPRAQRARQDREEQRAAQLRKDAIALLALPAFRRYVAHVVYGRLGLKRSTWRANAGETARAAARGEVAEQILAELAALDRTGFILLEQEHVARMADELEVVPTNEESNDVP